MLVNDFYTVHGLAQTEGSIQAILHWNKSHDIFRGHFPGQPVVPGVCMLQIIKELMESSLGRKLALQESSQMKFLQFIDPGVTPAVQLVINFTTAEDGAYKTAVSIQQEAVVFFRFTGLYLPSLANEAEV